MVIQTELFKTNSTAEFLKMCDDALGSSVETDADELRRRLPSEPLHGNWIGEWFKRLAQSGWDRKGWKRSANRTSHGRLIPVWRKGQFSS